MQVKAALASALDDDEGMADAGESSSGQLSDARQATLTEEASTAIVMATAAADGDAQQLEEGAAAQGRVIVEGGEPGDGGGAAGGLAGTPYETVLMALLEGLR